MASDTRKITEYIFVEDMNCKGDIAFVFGTWNAWKASVEKAAELYKKDLVPKIVVTGGLNGLSGLVEGDHMAGELMKLGVPAQDILIENKASNTLENVLFSLKLIDSKLGLKNVQAIVAVVKNYHARRALMTLRKHVPEHIQLKSAPYVSENYPFTKDTWMDTEIGKKSVLSEVEKIKTYLAKGDIKEL